MHQRMGGTAGVRSACFVIFTAHSECQVKQSAQSPPPPPHLLSSPPHPSAVPFSCSFPPSLDERSQVLSQIWSIVTKLQDKAAPVLASQRRSLSAATEAAVVAAVAEGGKDEGTASRGKEEEEEGGRSVETEVEPLVSTLLVAPRLHPFNAAQFDNFAQNLGIALKQTPIMDRIEVEVCKVFFCMFFTYLWCGQRVYRFCTGMICRIIVFVCR